MDQNRCLLDVIDNPQLLQSFLESESSAETTNNNVNRDNIQQQQATPNIISAHNVATYDTAESSSIAVAPSTIDQNATEPIRSVSTTPFDNPGSGLDSSTLSPSQTDSINDYVACTTSDNGAALTEYGQSHLAHYVGGQNDLDDQSSIIDPIGSVLDSIITDTVAETSPSTQIVIDNASDNTAPASAGNDAVALDINEPPVPQYSATSVSDAFCLSRTDIQIASPALDATPTYHNVGLESVSNINDANNNNNNNNSTSSSDNGSNELLVDEYYSQHLQQNAGSVHEHFQHERPMGQMDTSDHLDATLAPSPPDDTRTTAFSNEENMSKSQSEQIVQEHNQLFQQESSIQDSKQYHAPDVELQPQIQFPQPSQQSDEPQATCAQPKLEPQQPQTPQHPTTQSTPQLPQQQPQHPHEAQQAQQDSSVLMPSQTQQQSAQSQGSTNSKTSSTTTTKSPKTSKANNKNTTNSAPKAPDTKPKRAPRPKKPTKASNATTTPTQTQSTTTNAPIKPMPTQYMTTAPGQHQVIFQNNNGIRQPTMLAPTSMAQPMGAMQPQRVIQIQTANGPMYFAIAPGPTANANNNNVVINQQQQQTGMQSHQYPSQQICFQSNNNVILNRPQMTTTMSQQQRHQAPSQQQQQQQQSQMNHQQMQQHHQQMQSAQPLQQQQNQASGNIVVSGHQMMQSPQRMASPIMAGQTIAIANQQNSHQQQHVILPSSQPMMVPRMSNQIIMNRPMGAPGQLMPGQQQYIQVLTPNGPMLLALPQQQTQQQTINNTMIDYNNQNQMSRQMQQQPNMQQKPVDMLDGAVHMTPTKQSGANSAKNVSTSKSGLDLADLLLDCGILPEDRAASQSSSSIKSSQSPSLSQMSSPMPPNLPQTNSPMPTVDSTSFLPNQQQHTPQPMSGYGQYQGQPIRITMGPDGQMIMQPAVYGAIRPMLAGGVAQPTHLNTVPSNNIISSSSPFMAMTSSNPTTPKPTNDSPTLDNSKKTATKGKTAVKRSRSKKSDVDKFPQLKTPKIAQQQQQQQQQQQHQPQQPQTVAVVPMTFLVGDQSKVLAGGPDVKPNVTQLAGGQQVSLAKFVSPVTQSTQIQSSLGSNVMQTSIAQHTNSLTTNQVINSGQMNTQLITSSGNSINISNMQQQNSTSSMMTTSSSTSTNTSTQMSSSGNVTINLIKSDSKTGTVESNPHISSSLMPTITLTVDNLKIEQNGLKTSAGQISNQNIKGPIIHNVGGLTTTLVLHPAQAQQRHSINIPSQAQLQQQQMARKKEMRTQAILNQLKADQNAALNPQTKQPFKSIEDACKRLLRYHVFDTETVSETKIREVDEIFEAAVESLLTRKQAIYDKFRYLILKQSMKNVPMSEEVMLDQIFVNDELAYLKKERELFREYEAHLESIALDKSRDDTKSNSQNDCGQNYFAFGTNSPKQKDQVVQDNVAHSRDVDDWLLPDKWNESRYQSVPDSEAATAIESILNEEIS